MAGRAEQIQDILDGYFEPDQIWLTDNVSNVVGGYDGLDSTELKALAGKLGIADSGSVMRAMELFGDSDGVLSLYDQDSLWAYLGAPS